MIEVLRAQVDVPQDAHELSKLLCVQRGWQTVCLAAHVKLVTAWACHVSWKELCPTPKVLYVCRRATAVTSRLSLGSQAILMFVVRANFVGQKKKLANNLYNKILLNLSHAI